MDKMGIVIQARVSSHRFPGKALEPLAGTPLLGWIVQSLKQCRMASSLHIATSDDPSDDILADYARSLGVSVFRGSLDNVYERFCGLLEETNLSAFVRISGDSPLHQPQLVDQCLVTFREGDHDLVTNVFPRSFPKGQSVEVMRSSCFLACRSKIGSEEDREHVTPFFYRNSQQFKIKNILNPLGDFSSHNFCVDTPGDFVKMKLLFQKLDKNPHEYSLENLLHFWKESRGIL